MRLPPLSARFDVESSQTLYGVRDVTLDNQLIQNFEFMTNLSKTIAVDRKDGRDTVNLTLTNEFPDVLANIPGNLISLVDTFTGYTGLWRVRGTAHDIHLTRGHQHSVKYDIEAYDTIPFLVLDHAVMGKLDSGRVLAI